MNDTELDFAIDFVEAPAPAPAPTARNRTPLRLTLVACALASSATFLLVWQLETTKAFAVIRQLPAAFVAAAAPAAVTVAQTAPPAVETPTPLPLPVPKRHARAPAHPPREIVRSLLKEGSFAFELTGAAPVLASKQAVVVHNVVDEDDVAQVMRHRASAFRACYESALRANADIAGNVDVSFTIDPSGAVKRPVVRPQAGLSRAAAAPLTRCVTDTLKRTRFAPVASPTDVTHTLTFRRQTTI